LEDFKRVKVKEKESGGRKNQEKDMRGIRALEDEEKKGKGKGSGEGERRWMMERIEKDG